MRKLACLALLATIAACAPKSIPLPPVVSAPKFPEFTPPAVPASLSGTLAAANHDRGWKFLQAGDLKNAEREFESALRTTPAFYPAENGLGYVELARNDAKAALPHFDRALDRQMADLSALMGKGQALLALNRENEALPVLEAALAVDPSLTDVARHVEVLKFRRQQDDLNRARQAARSGRADDAIAIYQGAIQSSPDSAFLYRELAAVEGQKGDNEHALEHLRKAIVLEPGDARSLVQIGDILDARGDLDGAATAYVDALSHEAIAEVETKLANIRARTALARLPDEYRAIERAPQITRGDLAALVGVRLAALLQSTRPRDAVVVTDLRNHWASDWIAAVAQAGVMEPFANHAFQPRTIVRRVDLAQVVNRLLAKVAEATPGQPHPWQSARLKFTDIAAGHLAYPAASAAVASGVMTVGPDNGFQPSLPVSGQEASEAIDRIGSMARVDPARGKSGR
jgi:tetratricopeptide (TPR) repeat protein